MLTISTTLILALLGCALIGRRLYLNRGMRARASHQFDGTRSDPWDRQEIVAQEQAWQHLQQLADRKRRR
ncbi:MAG: hypothetical protein A2002_07420 [Pseudomonadales bacterium GWC1_66_9]|nr:MAG: hypothetical protein A2002_07420 [Pseudomonadales bacterium GWC1_66_9]